MSGSGMFTIHARSEKQWPGLDARPDGFVHFIAEDSGPGVPADLATRVFEPLFTTKPYGTGLGLAIVHDVVRKHGGAVCVDGSSFHVVLPATQAETQVGSNAPARTWPESVRRVVLIEDEEAVADALTMTLELEGVVDRLVDSLARAVRFEEAAVLIKTRDGMNLLATRGSRSKEEAQRLVPGAPHVVKALNTQQPSLNDGGQMLALPLIQRGAAIGVVCLETQRPYVDAEVRLALSLTQPAAMAVENARLFDEVQRLATLDGLTSTFNRPHFMQLALGLLDILARTAGQCT